MGHFCYICFVFVLFSCRFIAALWSLARKGLTSWPSCMWCFTVFLPLSHGVSWVRCSAWLYPFLIFAFFLTLTVIIRVKPGIFEHQVNSDSDLVVSYYNYWNKEIINLTNSGSPDETAHKEPSHLDSPVCKCVSDFTWCPKIPDFTIFFYSRYLPYHNHGDECHVSHVLCICYIIFFRYLLYHNHGNECHVSHVPCICYYYFISGIYFTIIMAMSAMSVMFSVFVIIISFQVFTLP